MLERRRFLVQPPDFSKHCILNYQRPEAGQPLDTLVLVGFGVEQKTS
jgi:hypothetical protein